MIEETTRGRRHKVALRLTHTREEGIVYAGKERERERERERQQTHRNTDRQDENHAHPIDPIRAINRFNQPASQPAPASHTKDSFLRLSTLSLLPPSSPHPTPKKPHSTAAKQQSSKPCPPNPLQHKHPNPTHTRKQSKAKQISIPSCIEQNPPQQ